MPVIGQNVGGFQLLAEIGRGGQGKVFLATQSALADRPVVVKFSPRFGNEHLTLARLQHTHIVPLHPAEDDITRDLRVLCMPYLGGASLAAILRAMPVGSAHSRTGRDLLDALDRLQATLPLALPTRGSVRSWLSSASYEQAVCWIGACLADALQYAHDRGLIHLDLTPANVLVTAEGVPMLLDFHLSREPIQPGAPGQQWLGGTPGYMAPEQQQAFLALQEGKTVPCAVDHHADIYALGVVLHEALGGPIPRAFGVPEALEPVRRSNRAVSMGLSDILHRCVALRPEDRYPSAARLADDLRRQLAGMPLRGVANRSLVERWRKWRRRRPNALALLGAMLALLFTAGAGLDHARRQRMECAAHLHQGEELLAGGQYAQAIEYLEQGRSRAASMLLSGSSVAAFDHALVEARTGLVAHQREQAVARLHAVVEQLRSLALAEALPENRIRCLEKTCEEVWQTRHALLEPDRDANRSVEGSLGKDLLDLAVIWADLKARHGAMALQPARQKEALALLAEAEKLHHGSAALQSERQRYQQALGMPRSDSPGPPARSAWDHLVVGRSLMGVGRLEEARAELREAINLDPQLFWSHYYLGLASYRQGQSAEAVQAFSVCLALAPRSAACYHNRGLAEAARGATDQALRDYTRALELDPTLGTAAFNRGLLNARRKHYAEAVQDLRYAIAQGTDPATVKPILLRVQQAANR